MASLKCSHCGSGIHYHGMPEGIEYIFIKLSEWEQLIKINCPSDKVELDYDSMIVYSWKCPVCGAFAFFDTEHHHTHVTHVYKMLHDAPSAFEFKKGMEFGLFFDDYMWDEITEVGTPMRDILVNFSGYHWMAKDEREMFIFEDREMNHCVAYYERVEVAKE